MVLVTKRLAVAPFELKLGPNESYGRAASVGTPPGVKKSQIRAKIIVKLPIHRSDGRYVNEIDLRQISRFHPEICGFLQSISQAPSLRTPSSFPVSGRSGVGELQTWKKRVDMPKKAAF